MSLSEFVGSASEVGGFEAWEKGGDLYENFNYAFIDLADRFFSGVTNNISEILEFASSNPLCIVLSSCFLVVFTFHLIPSVFNVFRHRH